MNSEGHMAIWSVRGMLGHRDGLVQPAGMVSIAGCDAVPSYLAVWA